VKRLSQRRLGRNHALRLASSFAPLRTGGFDSSQFPEARDIRPGTTEISSDPLVGTKVAHAAK
jgi:hypothetical protein